MKPKQHGNELEQLIHESLKINDTPSPELNNQLKAKLHRCEETAPEKNQVWSISVWYVPMLLNLMTFAPLGILSYLTIPNPQLAAFAALICGYISIAGVIITIMAKMRTNLKEDLTLHISKGGILL